jgi:hypothetical protein
MTQKGNAHTVTGPSNSEQSPQADGIPIGQLDGEENAASADSSPGNAIKKRRRQRPIRIGDALRSEGLDERQVARKLADVVTRHTPDPKDGGEGSTDKLLVDVLKECLRHLDDGPSTGAGFAAPKLIHKVPRPERAEPQTGKRGNET